MLASLAVTERTRLRAGPSAGDDEAAGASGRFKGEGSVITTRGVLAGGDGCIGKFGLMSASHLYRDRQGT